MTRLGAWLVLVGCIGLTCALPAQAKEPKPGKQEAGTLPDPLTRESIRELVSRLSDAEVRALLIKQLDRAAVPAPAAKKPAGMAAVAQATGEEFAQVRERAAEVLAAAPEFPAAMVEVGARIAEPHDVSRLWLVAFWSLVLLAAGAAGEVAIRFLTRAAAKRIEERPADNLAASSVRFVLRAGLGITHLAAFAAAAVGLFVALWQGHEGTRLVMLVLLAVVLGVRLAALLAALLLEPAAPKLRLVPLDDGAARALYWGTVRIAILFAFSRAVVILFAHFAAPQNAIALWDFTIGTLALFLVLDTIWRLRAPVAALIRGPGEPGALRRLVAEFWAAFATLYMLLVYASRMHSVLTGDTEPSNAPIISVLLVLALPLIDMYACRIVRSMMLVRNGAAGAEGGPATSLAASFEPVLQKAIHIVVIVAGLLVIAEVWSLDLFAIAERGLGGRVTGSFLSIAIILLIAWILWEVAHTAIDQRMGAETVAQGHKVSRLRTLLPLMRSATEIAIVVIAVLSVLAALGVNILPLLAGASVVGVAIGFGSQTLVRDIVSGAFFLMDDAFRLGEYIEVGDAKGTVEKIGVRSVILRHHRGALNVLPYGEIKRLRNTSRDWMIMKMEFPLAHDTDLKKVKQIVKKVGQEIADDPELSKHLIEPLKSQGVAATDDSALLVRVKYMADPASGGAFTIRREAYAKIIKAFAEAGIKFASRQVTVNVAPGAAVDTASAGAAGAAAAAAASTGKKD